MLGELIHIPKIIDNRGNLSFVEELNQIPFEIKRAYWIYDVPGGETRGGHAYRENVEFIIALSGSFDIELNNGVNKQLYTLNRSYYGLYVPKGIWRQMHNFSTNALALVLSSTLYDETDYIRDYSVFQNLYLNYNSKLCINNEFKGLDKRHRKPNSEVINHTNSVYDCTIIELDKHHSDRKGNITVVENNITVPFDIKRSYYLYDIPGGEERGAHAHKKLLQLIIAASGSFDIVLNDGNVSRTFSLNRPNYGLLVVPGIWRVLNNFSSGSVCLVLASMPYVEEDYIRLYQEFLTFKSHK